MYQNYNYYPQQQPASSTLPLYQSQPQYIRPVQQQPLKGRLVSSIDEARTIAIDFDGSVFYFPDIANRRIYTKQINMDGTATFNVYELKENVIPNEKVSQSEIPPMIDYVTKQEFNQAISEIKNSLPHSNASEAKKEVLPF